MKKLFIMLLSAMLCMSAVACSTSPSATPTVPETEITEETVIGETDPVTEEKFSSALSLIEEEKYEEAYLMLKECGDYEAAVRELENFKFVYGTRTSPMDGGEYSIQTYIYDDRGNCIREKHLDGKQIERSFDSNGRPLTETVYSHNETLNYIYVHNEDGTVSQMAENEDDRDFIDTYDSKMNLIKSEYYIDGELDFYNVYTYDSDSKLLETVCSYADGSESYAKYEYDEYGNLIRSTAIDSDGVESVICEYDNILDDEGKCIETHLYREGEVYWQSYRYIYDEYGNIIEEIMFMTGNGSQELYSESTVYAYYQLFYIG